MKYLIIILILCFAIVGNIYAQENDIADDLGKDLKLIWEKIKACLKKAYNWILDKLKSEQTIVEWWEKEKALIIEEFNKEKTEMLNDLDSFLQNFNFWQKFKDWIGI